MRVLRNGDPTVARPVVRFHCQTCDCEFELQGGKPKVCRFAFGELPRLNQRLRRGTAGTNTRHITTTAMDIITGPAARAAAKTWPGVCW